MSDNPVITGLASEKHFQEKMLQRIRESIGDLLPDDMLAKMVQRGVEEAFFAKRVSEDRWGNKTTEPSWLVAELSNICKDKVRVAVDEWLKANQDRVMALVQETLGQGLLKALLGALESLFRDEVTSISEGLYNKLRSL